MQSRKLDTLEAAEYIGAKPGTLEVWRVRGTGPRFIKLGRTVRYDVRDLDAFLASRTYRSTTENKEADGLTSPDRTAGGERHEEGDS